ncbi:PfkB family carbohydrate kinase [Thermoproteota archaeon]
MAVTIIGTVAYDSITTPKGSRQKILGGSAVYAGIAANLFTDVHLISVVGEDFEPEHLDCFQSRCINIDGIHKSVGKTFAWKGSYEGDMNQAYTHATELNVLCAFDPVIPYQARQSEIVFLANIDPKLQKKALKQFTNPKLVIADTMNYWIENHLKDLKDTLELVDVLIINDQEVKQLTGKGNVVQAIREASKMGPKRVIVKKGEHGSMMYNSGNYFACPAHPVEDVVDPTGAGDSFAGGLAGYLDYAGTFSEDMFKESIIVGTLVSFHTLQGFGLETLFKITKNNIREKYSSLYNFTALPRELSF